MKLMQSTDLLAVIFFFLGGGCGGGGSNYLCMSHEICYHMIQPVLKIIVLLRK